MKKIFAIALAVVMVLSIASVASAFVWDKPADTTPANFGYSVDVVKYTLKSGYVGTSAVEPNDAATAVNNADVYFAVKLSVTSTDYKDDAAAKITITSLGFEDVKNVYTPNLKVLGVGDYYWIPGVGFKTMQEIANNNDWSAVVFAKCLDTETAKVTAKVSVERPLTTAFNFGDYIVQTSDPKGGFVAFFKPGPDGGVTGCERIANFYRNNDGLVTKVVDYAGTGTIVAEDVMDLYAWLNDGSATAFQTAVDNKQVYMTNSNLWAAFGYSYSQSDSATWQANSTPIILDPTVSIPKTGDNASVIGFAMIMVAVVAAAVAVRKVNA